MKLLCVFSTLSAPVEYVAWRIGENGNAVNEGSVLIKGGAGLANANLITPRGVPTMITEAQRQILEGSSVFKLHEKNGFVTIEEVDRPPGEAEVEKVVAGLEGRDNSSSLVPQDFEAAGQEAPTTGEAPKSRKR